MLRDAELDSLDAQVRQFRVLSGRQHDALLDVVRQYERLLDDYRSLRSDYEEEKENREKYKRQARGLVDRNPFVLLLVDGDGYLFDDQLIKAGAEGGARAAELLAAAVRERVLELSRDGEHWRVVVRVCCNLAAVSRVYGRAGLVGGEARAIAPFTAAFSGAKDLFEVVDCGDKKLAVSTKVEETFRLFSESNQCKHIFFAGCHNTRYLDLLASYAGRTERFTLVKAADHQHEFQRLSLPSQIFPSVFRVKPLDSSTANAPNTKVKGASETSSPAPSVNGQTKKPCKFFIQKGWCKFGKGCSLLHERPAEAAGDLKTKAGDVQSGSKDLTVNWRAQEPTANAFSDDWGSAPVKNKQPSFADDWGNAPPKGRQPSFADDWGNAPAKAQPPSFADDWGNAPVKAQSPSFADDWGKGTAAPKRNGSESKRSQAPAAKPVFADDWGTEAKPPDGPLFADDWGTSQPMSRSTSTLNSRAAKPVSQPPQQAPPKSQPMGLLKSRRGSVDATDSTKAEPEPPARSSKQERKFSNAFTTAADLPRPSAETEGLIPLNKYGDRLDYYLPRPKAEEYAEYNSMVKEPGRKPCNDYQLKGHCNALTAGRECEFNHDPLPTELFHVLKVIVQGYPCSKRATCRRADCYNGHVCQRPGCRGGKPCKFCFQAHNLDPKVAEWVPAIDMDDQSSVASVNMAPDVKPEFNPNVSDFNPLTALTSEWTPTPVESAAEWMPAAPLLAESTDEAPALSVGSLEAAEFTPSLPVVPPESAEFEPSLPVLSPEPAKFTPAALPFSENGTAAWAPSAAASEWMPAEPAGGDWNPAAAEWKPSANPLADDKSDVSEDGEVPDDEIFGDNATRAENGNATLAS
ncbi:uncharacterized protein K452DRAFT_35282 [Aplosporella prunicola CBS 121167]|uniref:C3H1-type domain-containing protein n=1 Tax=Aplosporella prunicola CBS 121167 TaxID=1176127 RepID=A0A6A6BGB1_9PEZI|nr:uncharacterized protein K452DRAFT_35282 [Aplosporella prunicola CBS 121167]KAF2141907.1 hypothetical protein K452DRAFT_35282 [Aplosporella prunicola CBS 121167]